MYFVLCTYNTLSFFTIRGTWLQLLTNYSGLQCTFINKIFLNNKQFLYSYVILILFIINYNNNSARKEFLPCNLNASLACVAPYQFTYQSTADLFSTFQTHIHIVLSSVKQLSLIHIQMCIRDRTIPVCQGVVITSLFCNSFLSIK